MKKLALALLLSLLAATLSYAQQYVPIVSGTVTIPAASGSYKVLLSQSVTVSFASVPQPYASPNITVIFAENATGGFTVTFSGVTNACTVTTTASATTICQFTFDSTTNTWVGLGSGSGNAQNSLGAAGPNPQYALYNVYLSGGTVYARNNSTGAVDYSGSDAGTVINSILTNNSTTCGTVNFKQGDYSFNTFTQESTGGYSNWFYAVGIPANAGSASNYCQWSFIGDGATNTGQSANPIVTGVIFDVTAAGLTSCGTGNECVAWWHRPDTTNHTGNDIVFKNITTRFPANQRGNEAAYLMWEASTVDYYNALAQLNTAIGTPSSPSISPAVAGGNHMIGMSSTMSGRNNWNRFTNTWVAGYDIGYDIESEHSILDAATAFACNYFGQYGRLSVFGSFTGAVLSHPGIWRKITDQENINGLVLGSNIQQGTLLDIDGYDIETLASGSFARVSNASETNNGYTSGVWHYTLVGAANGIVAELPEGNLFTSGGSKIQMIESTTAPNISRSAVTDTFTRPTTNSPNSGQNFLGPAWQPNSSGSACGISSNTAITGTASGAVCVTSYAAQSVNNDQFSKIIVGTPNANGQTDALVRASSVLNTQTFYEYDCSTSGGQIPKRRIAKQVAATFTSLATTAANSGCAAGDTMELWAVGSTIIGFYTPSGGARTVDLIATDSSITSGQPGIEIFSNASSSTPTISNFVGGSLPSNGGSILANAGLSSIFGQTAMFPSYNTLTNCLAAGSSATASAVACGSSAAGLFSIPITTPTSAVVTTTALTPNSEISVIQRLDTTAGAGAALNVTCNTTPNTTAPNVTARTANTFTITFAAFGTNPGCYQYTITN